MQTTAKVLQPSELLAAAAAIAAGTQAYGEVVVFTNPDLGEPGHFDWDPLVAANPNAWLDITRPSTDQGGLVGPSSVGQLGYYDVNYVTYIWNASGYGALVAAGSPFYVGVLTLSLSAGAAIDNQLTFTSTMHAVYIDHGYYGFLASEFATGERGYMAARFSDVDGYHYGWIGVIRQSNSLGLDFDAFAWGYETEPGVPIIAGIPAPGTLAALAFGAVVTRRGRKRENN